MLIYTKKGRYDNTAINVTSSAGFQKSDYTKEDKQFQQKHSVEFSNGIKNFSYVIGGNYRTQDDYLPKGSIKTGGGYANFNYVKGKFKFVLSNNYNINSITNSTYPVFDTITGVGDFLAFQKDSAYVKDNYRIHSGGVSVNTSFQVASWWTHNLVLGYSENSYHYLTDISVYTDTTIINYYTNHGDVVGAQEWNSKDKTPTISYNNVIKIGKLHDPFKMNIMSGFEYSNTKHAEIIHNQELHYTTAGGFTYIPNIVTGAPFYNYNREFTGAFLQLTPTFKEKYFLVAGARYEKSNVSKAIVNPRVGFTTNFDLSRFIIKPRINWGKSITPPPYYITHPPPSSGPRTFVANPDIKQKEQSGTDLAVEVYDKKNKLKLEIVGYDNIIKNDFATIRTATNNGTAVIISYINIGKYAHKGWEFSAEYKIGEFKISGNYSSIKATYLEDYQGKHKGDRVNAIPDFAAGASLNYTIPKLFGKSDYLSATLSMTSSGKMIWFDYYLYTIDDARWQAGNGPDPSSNDYTFETPAVTKFNLNVDYQFHPNLRFFVQAQNFTNNTTPDWDRTFPVPGASWMFGLSFNFNKPSTK
jgi:outer membrane receptor protein involved in Fe transport